MKRKLSYIFIIFISMFMYNEVGAAELLFRCEYTVNLSKFATAAEDKSIFYYVDIYDDKSVSVSDFSSITETVLNNSYYITLHSSFKKNFKKSAEENTSCPTINFEYDGNTIFTMNTGSYTGEASVSSEGKIIEKASNVQEDKIEETCIRTKELRNDKMGVQITFYRQGESKMWSITGFYKVTGTATGKVNEILSIEDKTFDLEQDVIDAAFASESKCVNTKIYLRTPPTSNLNTITLTKPEDSENGSYAVDEAYKDTGLNIEKKDESEKEDKIVTNGETIKIVRRIYHIIKILIPVLIILLSAVDFLKVVIVNDEKNYKSAWDKFVKRLMIGVIFFIVPVLVNFILNYSGIETEQTFLDIFK